MFKEQAETDVLAGSSPTFGLHKHTPIEYTHPALNTPNELGKQPLGASARTHTHTLFNQTVH